MFNSIERFTLIEIAEQYLEEAPSEHAKQCGDDCLGCRKLNLANEILAFIGDFDDGA